MTTLTLLIIHISFVLWFYVGYKFGKKLKQEIINLKNDLQELSKELLKND